MMPSAVKNPLPNTECVSDGPEDGNDAPMEQVVIDINSFDHVNLYNDNVDLP